MILAPTQHNIALAAQALAEGQLLGLPTETVYGLAANASDAQAVAGIYALKGRPADHPLIVHLAPKADVAYWAKSVPTYAQSLMNTYWPGPLTLVLPRTDAAKDFVTGGQNTVALRCPSHPVAQAVLQAALALGVQGIAAPSANRFGKVSPTTAQHVDSEFEHPPMVLDGGACEVGIESTIVDCTGAQPKVLRHGLISIDEVARAVQMPAHDAVGEKAAPRVSGSLQAHYAPTTPLSLCSAEQLVYLPAKSVYLAYEGALNLPQEVNMHVMPADAALYARQLYATLRQLDAMQFTHIAVQPVPPTPQWAGVADRLLRAAASFAG